MRVPAYFGTATQDCDEVRAIDIDEIATNLAAQVDTGTGAAADSLWIV